MTEEIWLIRCSKCNQHQQTVIRTKKIYGKSKICNYCGKSFTLNRDNLIRKLR